MENRQVRTISGKPFIFQCCQETPELVSIKTLSVQNVQLGAILPTGAPKPEITGWLQNFKCHIARHVLSICAKHHFVQFRS